VLVLSLLSLVGASPVWAAVPPVRISIVAANGDGNEQDVADRISGQLEQMPNVVLSTVNPDWFVKCAIRELNDQHSGQIKYNGTVTVVTADGQTVSTTSVQKYNQDFSLHHNEPLNKALVDGAIHKCVEEMSSRAIDPIEDAIQTEIGTRERVLDATKLGDVGQYDKAIEKLQGITPDSTHFKQVRALMAKYQRMKLAHPKHH
jgi:hypothetical protein